MDEPLLDDPGLQHRDEVGEEVVVAEAGGEVVTDEEHHDRHHVQAHEAHHLRVGIVTRALVLHRHTRVEEHRQGHQEGEQGDVVHPEDARAPMDDVVIGGEVLGPQERLLAQLDGGREETEHRPQDRELEEHRKTAAHHVDTRLLVQVHGRLLFLHGVFLLGILGVDLVQFRPEDLHFRGGRKALVGERQDDQLDEDGHQEDDETEALDELAQPVEQRDDHPLGDQADDPAAQRNHLLVGVVIGLEPLVVVRTEIELEGDVDARSARLDVRPHLRGAGHQILARVVLAHEVDAELAVGEVLRRPHDGGEELLLEGEPFDLVVEALGALAAVADVLGLLVIREVVVQAGVLALVLVALLHPRDDGLEVHVDAADVARNQVLHVHEGEHLVHGIGILHKGVGFLDVPAVGEREAHDDGGVGGCFRDKLEVELPGVHGGRGIHDKAQLGLAFREDIQVRLVVGLIVLHTHGERLGAHRGEDDFKLLVLEGDGLRLGVGGCVQE